MSIRRLTGTVAAMLVAGLTLSAGTPDLSWISRAGDRPAETLQAVPPETLVLCLVAALAWITWAWGCLGLLMTALSAAPGAVGTAARATTRCLLPYGARRAASLALGVGLVAGGPLTACAAAPGTAQAAPTVAAVAGPVPAGAPVADWPVTTTPAPAGGAPAPHAAAAPVADWPAPAPLADGEPMSSGATHVVLRGECLWDIAAADLQARSGRRPTEGETAEAVTAWWSANAELIGADPDLLLPGQVLRPPPS